MSETKSKTDDATAKPPEVNLTTAAQALRVVATPTIAFISFIFPYVVKFCRMGYAFYKALPKDEATFVIGFIFCFFGGLYPTLFAAIQAAKFGGVQTFLNALGEIADEAMIVMEANEKDDELDEDKDGKRDVDQLDSKSLLMRKTNLVLTKMNPKRVDEALSSMYKIWIAVVSVLTVQFARTISLALAISEFVRRPVDRFIAPTIELAVPDKYDKWVPVILGWIIKSFAMSIAWFIQKVISAFTSALQGGLMMSQSLLLILSRRGLTFGVIPSNPEDTMVDEIVSYGLAAAGFYFQYKLGFDMPFPFNFLLFPFEIAEYYIQWTITSIN